MRRVFADRKQELRRALEEVRSRTFALLNEVPDEFLKRRVHSFYSPIGWHFGHIARTEQYWVGQACGSTAVDERLDFLFTDRPDNPKDNRVHLPDRKGIVDYLNAVREATLQRLADADFDSDDSLLRDGYAWEFALQHECQHQETICEMLHLIHKSIGDRADVDFAVITPKAPSSACFEVPDSTSVVGTDDVHAYDNEKPAHEVNTGPFRLSASPVKASEWLGFMLDGGYRRPELWSAVGWTWRQMGLAEMPEYWLERGGRYGTFTTSGVRPLIPEEPVCGISWFEADAFARWARMRLPSEQEWEVAAHLCLPMMLGTVWQWTTSTFLPYSGFKAFPYEGYSKEHMDGLHKVCRGGSWATAPRMLRCSFRNWYVPTYRQGFLGVRLAT